MSGLIDLIVETTEWTEVLPDLEALAEEAATLALDEAGVAAEERTIALLACDDARIAELNSTFRDTEKATNILSWPAHTLPIPDTETPPSPPAGHLGDLAIALATIRSEAEEAGLPLKNHVRHLILHGVLHLLGYDHHSVVDAEVMERLEIRALNRIGVPDPYK